MPHFGLMDPAALGPELAALQRARLHLRGGKRRLRQGKISAGIVTVYDALTSAMDWYCASPARRSTLSSPPGVCLNDRSLYAALVQSGILDGALDFERLTGVVDKALDENIATKEISGIVEDVEAVLAQLGVLPFEEDKLPPEDPRTL